MDDAKRFELLMSGTRSITIPHPEAQVSRVDVVVQRIGAQQYSANLRPVSYLHLSGEPITWPVAVIRRRGGVIHVLWPLSWPVNQIRLQTTHGMVAHSLSGDGGGTHWIYG